MKKTLSLLLAIVILIFCVACDDSGDDATISATKDGNEPTHSQNDSSTTAPTTEPIVTTDPTENSNDEVTLAETVIYDDDDVKITIKGLTEGWSGPEVKLLVENNSDKNIVFSGTEYIVNGVTISGYAYIDVAAGKKTNDSITLYADELDTAGIHSVATIQGMDCRVYDSDSFADLFDVPFAVETSIAEGYIQEIDDSGDVLFNEAGVTVVAKSLHEDLFGFTVVLLVKNDAGKDITVQAENISVNGFTISGWMYDEVYEDTVRYCEISLSSTDLKANDIETVESVTFTINIIDPDTYDRIAESDEIGITVG